MSDEEEVYEAEQATDVDRFWLTLGQETLKESITALEAAAKQLIRIVSILQGIYFAAISFSNLKRILVIQSTQGWFLIILFVPPSRFGSQAWSLQ
ncbi:MAG: hypothetical protein ACXV3D_04065 [Halobacteriota archaeon]